MNNTMSKKKRAFLVALSFLMMTIFVSTFAPAVNTYAATKKGTVTASTLNLRKKASTSSSVVKKLKKGTTVTIHSTTGSWYKVTASGKTGYVSKTYIKVKKTTTKTGYSKCDDLNLRKSASTSAKVLLKFDKGDSMTILSTKGKWYKVKASGKTGYVYKSYVTTTKPSSKSKSASSSSKVTGSKVVAYAKKFLGNPYRYGGTSLTKGTDCSGFTQSVYRHFGISIPRTSSSQRSCGKKVSGLSSAKAGDIICYSGHVAIYMGSNKIIHASNKKDGIKISNNAKYKKILAIRRLV